MFAHFSDWHLPYRMTTIIIVTLVPFLGLYSFLVVERRYSLRTKLKIWKIKNQAFQNLIQQRNQNQPQVALPPKIQAFSKFSEKFSVFPFSNRNQITFFETPIKKIYQLHQDLKAAKKYIYFNFYIFSDGEYLDLLVKLLITKVQQGVQVKIIYDFFGTISHSSMAFLWYLKKHGVILKSFGTKSPFLASVLERNHRKDVIIDGIIAHTGGSNIGDEYLGLSSDFGYFADLDVRLIGDVVRDIEMIFWKDWMICTGENIFDQQARPIIQNLLKPPVLAKTAPQTWIQTINDGPNIKEPVNRDIFFNLFTKAKRRIWFATPYFFIDAELNKALINAAWNGLDVRIFLHDFQKFWLTVDLSRLHYDELLEAGIKLYEYSAAYLHSKLILVDDDFISVGTSNMDFSSFYYCYQTTLLIFDQKINRYIERRIFQDYLNHSLPITKNPLHQKSVFYRWILKFVQIFTVFL